MRALWESTAERMYEQLELIDWFGDCVDVISLVLMVHLLGSR
jgi:hypothetical protein